MPWVMNKDVHSSSGIYTYGLIYDLWYSDDGGMGGPHMYGRLSPSLLTSTLRKSVPDARSHTRKLPLSLPVSTYLLSGVTAMVAVVVPSVWGRGGDIKRGAGGNGEARVIWRGGKMGRGPGSSGEGRW